MRLALFASCLLALASPAAAALNLPPGFVAEAVPFTFDVPTAIAFLPGGRLLVAEKGGIVYVVEGAVRHPMWVHEEEILNTDDRGLLAIAVDPDFVTNRYLYFLYTVDPDSNGIELDHYDDTFARLTRYRVSAIDSNAVDETTRTVLLGATWREGFAEGSGSHTIAALEWGRDGSLLVSAGDGAHYDLVDSGGADPGLFGPDRTDPLEDIGAFRAQDLRSLDGKILRIDPATGDGLASNPYYDGNPHSNRSRVWAYGLRNPFRIARRPGTGATNPAAGNPGTLYVGDVGWETWEEVDVARAPGRNFGWPCYEGRVGSPDYLSATPAHHGCGTIGTPENPALPTAPIVALHHLSDSLSVPSGSRGGVIAGGVFYSGTSYPSSYWGGYFFGDYSRDWIHVLQTDAQDLVVSVHDFATGTERPVAFATDPASGDLAYVAIESGVVRRIRYTGPAAAGEPWRPSLALSAPYPNPSRGAAGLTLDLPYSARVSFAVYDLAGREVWRALEQDVPAGRTQLVWPGVTRFGAPAPTGVYLVRVADAREQWTRRLVLLR